MIHEQRTVYMTSREFNRDVAKAKRASKEAPVIVTDRGEPAHVLLDYQEYKKLKGFVSLRDSLYDPKSAHIELELPERPMLDERRIPNFSDEA